MIPRSQRHFEPWVYQHLNAALLRQLYGPPAQCAMHSHGRCHRSIVLEHSDPEPRTEAVRGLEVETKRKLGKGATSELTRRDGGNALANASANATSNASGDGSSQWSAASGGGLLQATDVNQQEAADAAEGDDAWSEEPSRLLRAWPHGEWLSSQLPVSKPVPRATVEHHSPASQLTVALFLLACFLRASCVLR